MCKLSLPGIVILLLAWGLTMVAAGTAAAEAIGIVAQHENPDYLCIEQLTPYIVQLREEHIVETITHIVERGETLFAIARRYGVTVATISESNNIANPHLIYPGQQLIFPAVAGLLYTVEEGDTLAEIAEKYQVAQSDILLASGLTTAAVEPGQRLIIPGAELPDPPPLPVSASPGSRSGSSIAVPSMIWPVQGRITSGFGYRWGRMHYGLDISGHRGTEIRAAADGIVTFSGYLGSYGNVLFVEHNSEVRTVYAHAQQLLVKKGERVRQGQVIATVGSSGRTTGPHLHFEIIVRGTHVNPLYYLP